MSKVTVTWYGLIRNFVDKQAEDFFIPDSATVRELLRLLVERHDDAFRANIFMSDWQLQPTVLIHFSGRDINEIDGLDTKLGDNSELTITVLPLVTGGG